jgi:nucleotide-binding universal stress UspA family protein
MHVAVTVDLAELLLRLEHACSDPPHGHGAVAPALDVAMPVARDGDHRLDRVGGAERAQQRRWEPEPRDAQRLLQSLTQRRRSAGVRELQLLRERSELAFG